MTVRSRSSRYAALRRFRPGQKRRATLVAMLRERDGDRCCYCDAALDFGLYNNQEAKCPPDSATIEHVVPHSIKPVYALDDLALACLSCNHAYGALWSNYRAKEGWLIHSCGRLRKSKPFPAWPGLMWAEEALT